MSAPWTREKNKHLLRLHSKGLSAAQIADQLGTTRGAVIGRSVRLRGLVSTGCGIIGADVRPNWKEPTPRETLTGVRSGNALHRLGD